MKLFKVAFVFVFTLMVTGCHIKNTTKRIAQKPTKKPNIIFIMSDDHAYQAISAYSDTHDHPTL